MKRFARVSASILALAGAQVAAAQPAPPDQTQITPDMTAATGLGTLVGQDGNVHVIDGGRLSGTNLFHSFAQFDLSAGDVARWTHSAGDPTDITTIVNRINGGDPSRIFGTLDALDLPNADFYFINPAGIIIGADAVLDLPAAAHFSTAGELRFANGDIFSVAAPDGSTLSMDAPESFGFVGGQGAVIVDGPFVDPPGGGLITLTAGAVEIADSFIQAGSLAIAAVGDGAGSVGVSGELHSGEGGTVLLNRASINTYYGAEAQSRLSISASRLVLESSDLHAPDLIDLQASDAMFIDQTEMRVEGELLLTGGNLESTGMSLLSDSLGPDGGGIFLSFQTASIHEGSISADSGFFLEEGTTGDTGPIFIEAAHLEIGSSSITSTARDLCTAGPCTSGRSEGIEIVGGDVLLDRTVVAIRREDTRTGGDILIAADGRLTLTDLSSVTTTAAGTEAGGDVHLIAGAGLAVSNSVVATHSEGSGGAGSVYLDSPDTSLHGAFIFEDPSTVIIADTDPDRSLGTTVAQTGNTVSIDGGRLSAANLFHSFSRFELGRGDVATWLHSAGDAAAIRNVISRVTGDVASTIFGTLDMTAIPNADFYFINPSGIIFGSGTQVNVPAAAHFSAAHQLRFADGRSFGSAGDFSSAALPLADPSSVGFAGDQAAIFIDGAVMAIGSDGTFPTARATFSGGAIRIVGSDVLTAGGDLLAVGYDEAEVILGGPQVEALDGTVSMLASRFASVATTGGNADLSVSAGELDLNASDLVTFSTPFGVGGNLFVAANRISLRQSFAETLESNVAVEGDFPDDTPFAENFAPPFEFDSFSQTAGNVALTGDTIELRDNSIVGASSVVGGSVSVMAESLLLFEGSEIGLSDSCFDPCGASRLSVTADRLHIVDGTISFSASDGMVEIAASVIELEEGASISLQTLSDDSLFAITAIDLALAGDSDISASGGLLDITASRLDLNSAVIRASDFTEDFEDLGLRAAGIRITSDELSASAASGIISESIFAREAGPIELAIARELNLAEATVISASTFGEGDAGGISIEAGSIVMTSEATIASQAGFGASGDAGTIRIAAGTFLIDGGFIDSATFGDGAGGEIAITAQSMDIRGGAALVADTRAGGDAGAVSLTSVDLVIDEFAFVAARALEGSTGDAGSVALTADTLLVQNGALVNSATLATGAGGTVSVRAGEATIRDGELSSNSFAEGAAGSVTVIAAALAIEDEGFIGSQSFGSGAAGRVDIEAEALTMNLGQISTSTFGSGAGGEVSIEAGTLSADSSLIISDTAGTGVAGDVRLTASGIRLSQTIVASDTFGSGDSGSVTISGDQVTVDNESEISAGSTICFDLSCTATGSAGRVTVAAGQLTLLNGGSIISDTLTSGNAGDVSVTADRILIDGGEISSDASACVSLECVSSGDGGSVSVTAGSIELANGGTIASSTFGSGDAGSVTVSAGSLMLGSEARLESRAEQGSGGSGGRIVVTADSLEVTGAAAISSSTAAVGDAGSVEIAADQLRVSGGRIDSSSEPGSTGAAGSVSIDARSASLTNGGTIATLSANSSTAGAVSVAAEALTIEGVGSRISSENVSIGSGDAGRIDVESDGIRLAEGGRITTNSVAGSAGNIVLALPSDAFVILESVSVPAVIETSSGPGTGGQIVIASPLAIISDGGSILALGESGGANVLIDTTFFITSSDRVNRVEVDGDLTFENVIYDVSAGTGEADLSLLDASAVLRGQCPAVRSTGQLSQLSLPPIGPYVPRPAGPGSGPPGEPRAPAAGSCL